MNNGWKSSSCLKRISVQVVACHLPNSRLVKFLSDPISVGIDPVRKGFITLFCCVEKMIEVSTRNGGDR